MNTSKQTTNSSQTSTSAPSFAPQVNALNQAFPAATSAFNKANGAVAPTDFTAGPTPDQLATFHSMIGYGSNNNLPATNSAAGTDLLTGGTHGSLGALDNLGAFNPTMSGTAADAKTYANGLDIPGAVKNAMLAGTQQARDVINPMTENAAAGNGNINSSRTGLAEGLVDRGLAEQASGLFADMNNSAYGTGASLSQGNNAQRLSSLTGAGALGTALATGGAGINSQSIGDQGNLFTLAGQGGAGEQTGNQDTLTNLLQRYQSQVSSPFDAVNQFMSLIGGQNWGQNTTGTGTSTTLSTPSALQTIGGLMSSAGNLALGFGKMSDARQKDDVLQVGTLFDGQPVYRYRYKGHTHYELGLMAQEVEKVHPDAVQEFDGIKYVNYLEATKNI